MSSIAKFVLSEADALALWHAVDGDGTLSTLPVTLTDATGGHWHLVVYLTDDNQKTELAALGHVSAALLGRAAKYTVETLPETDWVAKSLEGLPPVRSGRFLVHGSHDRQATRVNEIDIEIEAGQAFGTGHHGTTAGCLKAIDQRVRTRPIANALDIGTGSGILAIAIAKAAKVPVLASDIDAVAVRVARENIRLNGVHSFVTTIVAANLKKRPFAKRRPYDLVVANILAGPLIALAPEICRNVSPGGSLILSGLLPGQRARMVAAYRRQGMALLRATILDGWLTLDFIRGARNQKGRSHRLRPSEYR